MEKRKLSYAVMAHRYEGRTQDGEILAGSVGTGTFEKSVYRCEKAGVRLVYARTLTFECQVVEHDDAEH